MKLHRESKAAYHQRKSVPKTVPLGYDRNIGSIEQKQHWI